ncbi:TPA: DUF4430 domain-containing protein [Enterococcus faecium]
MSTNKIAQLSLLSAACVAGRIAFQFIPNFQPMTAIFLFIVLYLSLKDALIVMSLSIAISSFYFGVGPWVIGQWISYTVVLSLFSIVCLRKTVQRNLWFLKRNFEVKEDNGFITSLEGHSQDEKNQLYWMFTVDGKSATTGAKEIKLNDGQSVIFNLSKL